jgi:multiple sugar transport system substrate-binding protein
MSFGNKVWVMPLFANADFVLHWNKAHFREAGLNPDKGPETIAELDAVIQRLTRERGGDLERVGMEPWNLYGHGNTIQAWGYAFGGSFYDEVRDELTFNHARVLRAVEWYTGWVRRLGLERVNRLRQEVATPGVHFFGSGRWSIHALTSPNLREVQKHDSALQIGAAPLPGEPPGRSGSVAIGGHVIGAPPSPRREQAWDFMRYIGADSEGTATIARLVGIPGWLKSPGLDEISRDPLQKAYVDGVRRAQHVQLGYYSPAGFDLNPIQEIIDGKRGIREALEEINRDANVRYKEWQRQVKK